jgi:hypothetical protein
MVNRRAIALPLVLVVLLVGGAFVAAALYMTENYYSSARQMVTGTRLYNAAVSGIEIGKAWIYENVKSGKIPHWEDKDGDGILSYVYEALLAKIGMADSGVFEEITEDGIKLHIVVYDLVYEPDPDLNYERGFPPRIRPQVDDISAVTGPSYPSANRVGSGVERTMEEGDMAIYLIRCIATYKDRTITVEQAVVMRL